MTPLTKRDLRRTRDQYAEVARVTDELLYDLCRRFPDHSSLAGTYAKVWVIGRTYATGIERHAIDLGDGALDAICHYLHEHGEQLDSIISGLSEIEEPLTDGDCERIVAGHGRFVELMRPAMREGNTPRSFAAKYLHFHNPVVPIFDNVAADRLTKRYRMERDMKVFKCPSHGDDEYYRHVLRFRKLYLELLTGGLDPNVREVDYLLWGVPEIEKEG